jgi:uridine phosphorylase
MRPPVYRELLPEDHRRLLQVSEEDVPDVLLLVGLFSVHEGARRWAGYAGATDYHDGIPHYRGRFGDLKVAVAAAFGGPMAALHVHAWCAAGVPAVVQLGFYGALQPGTTFGDVAVPRHAERQEGVSDWYLPKGILADASDDLADAIAERLGAHDFAVNRHAIYSTPAILAESREVIADWSRHGYHGVDMETAATFSVAKALGAKRAAALIRLDDLITEEHSLADPMRSELRSLVRDREQQVVVAVLEAVAGLRR